MTISGNPINVQLIDDPLILDDNSYRLVTCVYEKKKRKKDRSSALDNIYVTLYFLYYIHDQVFRIGWNSSTDNPKIVHTLFFFLSP